MLSTATKSHSLSLYHVGSCTLAISSICSCPPQVSQDDCRCYLKGPHVCTAQAWSTLSPLATYLNKLSSLSLSPAPLSFSFAITYLLHLDFYQYTANCLFFSSPTGYYVTEAGTIHYLFPFLSSTWFSILNER